MNIELGKTHEQVGENLVRYELGQSYSNDRFILHRPNGAKFFVIVETPDPAIRRVIERVNIQETLKRPGTTLVEASLEYADKFIRDGNLDHMCAYYSSWRIIKSPSDITVQTLINHTDPDGYPGYSVTPEIKEYILCSEILPVERYVEFTVSSWVSDQIDRYYKLFPDSPFYEEPFYEFRLRSVGSTNYHINLKKQIVRTQEKGEETLVTPEEYLAHAKAYVCDLMKPKH